MDIISKETEVETKLFDPKKRMPLVIAKLVVNPGLTVQLVPECPFCGEQHVHESEPPGGHNHHRAPCGGMYFLVPLPPRYVIDGWSD